MGLAPWKLNNTGNQIGYLYRQCCFYQWISNVVRKAANKHLNEQPELLFRRLEDGTHTVNHGSYDDLEWFTKSDIRQFVREEEKDFSQGTVVLTSSERSGFVQIKAIQSFLFFLLRTQTIFAGIFWSFPTMTSTESRYLLRPRRFLQIPKISLIESRSPSYS